MNTEAEEGIITVNTCSYTSGRETATEAILYILSL